MYKKIISLLFLCLSCLALNLKAQNSQTEAKAAYLLAEEAFAANDFSSALNYLDECKRIIGTPNCKIIYLQIMVELEQAKADPKYYDAALRSIAAFEKAPDLKDFNEEKVLEVLKSKLMIKNLKVKAGEKVKQEQENKVNSELLFSNWTWQNWPLSLSYDEVSALKKNDDFFKMVWETGKDSKTGIKLAYVPVFKLPKTLKGIYLKDDKVVGYSVLIGYYASKSSSNKVLQHPNYALENEALNAFQHNADSLSSLFGFKPQKRTPVQSYFIGTAQDEYYWIRENKTVSLVYYTERTGSAFIYLDIKISITTGNTKTLNSLPPDW